MENQKIERTIDYVKKALSEDFTGHDWDHIRRVYLLALKIQSREGGNLFIISMAALLHDITDWKLFNEEQSKKKLSDFLISLHIEDSIIQQIISIINQVSFKGNQVNTQPKCLEAMIVQDADRLDAIGAIGIARAFAYGAKHNRSMYNPDILPENHYSFEDYKKSKSTTINHFYEKLLLLKDRLNTHTAKDIALKRHQTLEIFLNNFINEWEGTI